jgi:hypothetical protein
VTSWRLFPRRQALKITKGSDHSMAGPNHAPLENAH